jgi:hypothetical protein
MDRVVAKILAVVADLEQHAVRERLARKRRARCAKRYRHIVLARKRQQLRHLGLVGHLDDHLGVEAVEGRIGAVRERAHWVRENACRRNELFHIFAEGREAPVVHAMTVDVVIHIRL